jgi:hypothetical protein
MAARCRLPLVVKRKATGKLKPTLIEVGPIPGFFVNPIDAQAKIDPALDTQAGYGFNTKSVRPLLHLPAAAHLESRLLHLAGFGVNPCEKFADTGKDLIVWSVIAQALIALGKVLWLIGLPITNA